MKWVTLVHLDFLFCSVEMREVSVFLNIIPFFLMSCWMGVRSIAEHQLLGSVGLEVLR
jgi:hypothetical protein